MKTLDIRVPMGLMFTLLGVVLTGYGLLSIGSATYGKSLGVNINLWWGLVMLAFGAVMFFVALRRKSARRGPGQPNRMR